MLVLQRFGVCECARIPLLLLLLVLLLVVGPMLLLVVSLRVLVLLRVAGFTAGFTEGFTEVGSAPFRGKGK